jgi:hypothetical protein
MQAYSLLELGKVRTAINLLEDLKTRSIWEVGHCQVQFQKLIEERLDQLKFIESMQIRRI